MFDEAGFSWVNRRSLPEIGTYGASVSPNADSGGKVDAVSINKI
jgi:hypothetical protein